MLALDMGLKLEPSSVPAPSPVAPARFAAASGDGTWLSVVVDVEPYSGEGKAVVESLRGVTSPLGCACREGQTPIVRLLLKLGADANAPIYAGRVRHLNATPIFPFAKVEWP